MMRGIAASPGIAIAKVYFKLEQKLNTQKRTVENVEKELERLDDALKTAEIELKKLEKETSSKLGEEEAEIFQAHLMFLDDPEFIPAIKNKIETEKINAEAAVDQTVAFYAQIFANMDNDYMRARGTDIKDVGKRIIKILNGKEELIEDLKENVVVAAIDLTPSDTAQLDKDKVLAFVTQEGSRTSHSAIMARSLGIPAVVGLGAKLFSSIKEGQNIIVDGTTGEVIVNPDIETGKKYQSKLAEYKQKQARLSIYKDKKAVTKDGKDIEVVGNIGNITDLSSVLEQGGKGIGLFRTEFLYMDREKLPTEEEQFIVYRKVAQEMENRPVVIRTLDIGGDKELPYLDLPKEMNPFLGYRAIRLCLDRPDIFKPQLKAILRASKYGNIKMMYPLISSVDEVKLANKILEECKRELNEEGKEYGENLEVGIMIEIPAAVMEADVIAQEVDFFSIGTNDLIQYTIAVDRVNEKIAEMHTPYHPAVLKMIKKTIDSAHEAGIWVGMCGEAAGDELLVPFLLGVGLDEFSMSAISILKVKELLSKWKVAEAEKLTCNVLKLHSAKEIKEYLSENAK